MSRKIRKVLIEFLVQPKWCLCCVIIFDMAIALKECISDLHKYKIRFEKSLFAILSQWYVKAMFLDHATLQHCCIIIYGVMAVGTHYAN